MRAAIEEMKLRESVLADMTSELEHSRDLMQIRFAELERREWSLETLVQESVQQALADFALSTGSPDGSSPVVGAETAENEAVLKSVPEKSVMAKDSFHNSAILMIRGSENKLTGLVTRFELPDHYKSERHEVHIVMDFYIPSVEKYKELSLTFQDSTEGAELILAVERFRDLFRSFVI